MRFAIATVERFNSLGFNTKYWRKSLDGEMAICHLEFALTLGDEDEFEIYDSQSKEFQELMESDKWTDRPEEDIEVSDEAQENEPTGYSDSDNHENAVDS